MWHNGTVPKAPRLDGKTFFWSSSLLARKMQRILQKIFFLFLFFTLIWQENEEKIPKVPGALRNVNPVLCTVYRSVLYVDQFPQFLFITEE